jgi:hypothetical protein
MAVPQPLRSPWTIGTFGVLLAVSAFGVGRQLGGPRPAPERERSASPLTGTATAAELPPPDTALQQPGAERIIEAQRKRIMGRLRSLEQVRRVATTIRPLVDRALEMPEVQADLNDLARAAGMTVPQYKKYFAGKQESDLLLESGGDPNARSVADAIGVAQFLAGTGRQCGLKIDVAASNALTHKIRAIERQIEWLEAQAPTWSKPVPAALAGVVPTMPASQDESSDSSLLPAPSPTESLPEGVWSRDQWIAYRKSQRTQLVAKRRRVDERYDPAKAIRAQTRYLVKLTRRYGGIDWALQAYHGGEAGASRTMRLFAEGIGSRTYLASRGASYRTPGLGGWLPYTELYQRVSPTATPAAFSYLFGRSDDHRYYWWKVLMAERALDLYRRDPQEFERQWKALQPGLNADAVFFPDPTPHQFADNRALAEAYRAGTLVRLPANAGELGVRTENLAVLAPDSTSLHKGLRPEAMGALLRLAQIYRSQGGQAPLTAVSMVQSTAYRKLWDARYPAPPLPPDVPKDPEFHTTGYTFDLSRPARDWDRKVLEYSLGTLYDNLHISWRKETEGGSQRYHVVVNPKSSTELTRWCQQYTSHLAANQ